MSLTPPERSFLRCLVVLIAAASALVPTATGLGTSARNEAVDETYQVGHLAWADGVGRIQWGAPTPAQGPVGVAEGEPPFLEFRAEPLGHPLYLDPADLVQVELFLHEEDLDCGRAAVDGFNKLARVSVALFAGEELIAAAIGPPNIAYDAHTPHPAVPSGYTLCSYRLPLEVNALPTGTTVRLRVTFEGVEPVQIGVSGSQASVVRLPTFTPEEAFYRFPEVIPRLRVTEPADASEDARSSLEAVAPATAGAGLLLLLPARHRGRRPAVLLVALVLSAALAGCLGAGSKGAATAATALSGDGRATISYEDPQDLASADASTASLFGRATDPYGYPVADAFVALLSTSHSAATNRDGVFAIKQLRPGDFTLRVDRPTFQSIEVPVKVRPNLVTRVDVVLAYDVSFAAGERPHVHDYWHGTDEALLFRGPLFERCAQAQRCTLADAFYLAPVGDDRKLVRPGTSEVEVRLDFDAAEACTSRLGLALQDNSDPSPKNWTLFAPRESGIPFRVKTTWEMTDVGHQLFSTWTFAVYGDPRYATDCGLGAPPAVGNALETLDESEKRAVKEISIVIKRGALPLEPRHPDHWRGAGRARIIGSAQHEDPSRPADNPFAMAAAYGDLVYCKTRARNLFNFSPELDLGAPAAVVPPETKRLGFYLNLTRPTGLAGLGTFEWRLLYKPGDIPPEPYWLGNPSYIAAPAPTVSADGTSYAWTIAIGDDEADGAYNKKSAWRFALVPDDPDARCLDHWLHTQRSSVVPVGTPILGPLGLSWTADAFKG